MMGEISSFKKINHGVVQACVLSPDLFSLFSVKIIRNLEYPRIEIGGHNVNSLRYADDTVLLEIKGGGGGGGRTRKQLEIR